MLHGEKLKVELSQIQPDPTQPRTSINPATLESLAKSLKARGQLVPVLLLKDSLGHFLILDGECRWRAASLAGLATLDAIVIDHKPDVAELRLIQLTINSQRTDLSPLDKAKAYQEIISLKNWTASELAVSLHLSNSTVTMLLAMLKLPLNLQHMVEDGTLDVSKAYYLSRIEDKQEQEELALLASHGQISREVLAKKTAKTKTSKTVQGTSSNGKRLAFALPDGYCISLTGLDLSLCKILSLLADLSKQARRAQTQGIEASTLVRQLSDQNKASLPT